MSNRTIIKENDVIQSVADAFQFISYYHSKDFVDALYEAYQKEPSEAAKNAMGQILVNSKMCAEGKRPICQDTGIANVFVDVGMNVSFDTDKTLDDLINEGVRKAYAHKDNVLRKSVLADPAGARGNTKDNTPAVIHTRLVAGDKVDITVAAKGGGSENKSKLVMMNPSDDLVEWVLKTVPTMGAGWCPPGILGIGIGGTAEQAVLMAKRSLMGHIDIHELQARGAQNRDEELRLELYEKVNKLGIGAQGLGGMTTVLDVKIESCPTHAASKPVALIPNCAATRHVHFTLDGSGVAQLPEPNLSDWPNIDLGGDSDSTDTTKRINLDSFSKADIADLKAGDTVLLTGKILTGRDAAHKKLFDMAQNGEPLPDGLDFNGRMIYYVGPVDAVRDEVVGPAGPTTSTRMDKFTDFMLDKTGLVGMIGKSERGDAVIESIQKHGAVYFIAVGGAAYLVSKAIRGSKMIAFPELGMEAIREFDVVDMPITVAVDSSGNSVHKSGPTIWKGKLAGIPVSEG